MRSPFAASAVVAAALATAAAPAARADTVSDWNGYASNAIVVTAGQPPPVAVLSFAMVQGAVYDAVDAIDGSRRAYLVQPPGAPPDSQDAAAATAAHDVLVALFPAQQTTLTVSTRRPSPGSRTRLRARRPAGSPTVRPRRHR